MDRAASDLAVRMRGVTKRFGDTEAVRRLSIGAPVAADIWAAIARCGSILVVFVPLSMRQFARAGLRD